MTAKGSSESETRNLPKLKPPGRDMLEGSAPGPGKKPLIILLGMIVLLAVTGAVLFILPRFLNDTTVQTTESAELKRPEASPTAPSANIADQDQEDQEDQGVARNAAAQALEAFLALKVQAEGGNITSWAEQAYQDILSIEERGDQYFSAREYRNAQNDYKRALVDLETLLGTKTAKFENFFQEGNLFLSEEKSKDALKSFTMALAISPDDQDALAGAQRAGTLDAVLALYRSALAHEQSGDLVAAEDALNQLRQLDKNYIPAQTLLDRVRKNSEKQIFDQQMSSFFSDLEKEDLKRARETLEKIKKRQNGHPEVIQAETLLMEKEETVLVNDLKKRAQVQSSKEQWEEALATYQQILTIAPDVLFAANGREQANKRIDLDRALKESLSQPHRLQEDVQLDTARRLLSYARQFSPGGERLANQIDQLDKLVTRASTVVPVVISSDNMTDVVIYHVGRMGTFFSKQITLKPGKYTVVGSRKGFRDIRTIFEVGPEKGNNQLYIECREQI